MHENMQKICNYLCQTLRQTRRFYDLLALEYVVKNADKQYVLAYFPAGCVCINVSLDSGWGMIMDIVKQLPCKS